MPLPRSSAISGPAGDPAGHDAGGDSVRALAGELSPGAVTILDWFHIALRMTGLEQYAKGLTHHNPVEAVAVQYWLERIQWRLWHGDGEEALARAQVLAADVAAL